MSSVEEIKNRVDTTFERTLLGVGASIIAGGGVVMRDAGYYSQAGDNASLAGSLVKASTLAVLGILAAHRAGKHSNDVNNRSSG